MPGAFFDTMRLGVSRFTHPALPAVRIIKIVCTPEKFKKSIQCATVNTHIPGIMVRRTHVGNSCRTVSLPDSFYLTSYQVQGFVPAYPFIVIFTPSFRMPFPIGVKTDPPHRVQNSIIGIDSGSLRQMEWRQCHPPGRTELLAVCLNCPGWHLLIFIKDQRADANYPAIFYMDKEWAATMT